MQNLPQVNIPALPISDPKTKFDGNPRNSLERIFEHYMNSSNNEVLSDEDQCFENIQKNKTDLSTNKLDIMRAMELIILNPENREISELYLTVCERFDEEKKELDILEKARFSELVAQNNPSLTLSLMLLNKIEKFDFEEDYKIIKTLNLNKSKSENSKEIFDKTLDKFKTFLDKEKLDKLEKRLDFDRVLNTVLLETSYESDRSKQEKEIKRILSSSKYYDKYFNENLQEHYNETLKYLGVKYYCKFNNPNKLINLSNLLGQTTPPNSLPSTPQITPSEGNNNFPSGIEPLHLQTPNPNPKPKVAERDLVPKKLCTIS